jgi:NAD(P)-dependent dehydrogenase (short-subunit alcohol dehydrogenase family)
LSAIALRARHDGAETLLVFRRGQKRADHRAEIVRRSIIENIEPELVTALKGDVSSVSSTSDFYFFNICQAYCRLW